MLISKTPGEVLNIPQKLPENCESAVRQAQETLTNLLWYHYIPNLAVKTQANKGSQLLLYLCVVVKSYPGKRPKVCFKDYHRVRQETLAWLKTQHPSFQENDLANAWDKVIAPGVGVTVCFQDFIDNRKETPAWLTAHLPNFPTVNMEAMKRLAHNLGTLHSSSCQNRCALNAWKSALHSILLKPEMDKGTLIIRMNFYLQWYLDSLSVLDNVMSKVWTHQAEYHLEQFAQDLNYWKPSQ